MTAAKAPARARLRIGALLILTGCFVVSALLRAGEVIAALPGSTDDGYGNPIANTPAGEVASTGDSEPGASQAQVEEPSVLVAELRRQRAALEEREAQVAEREQMMKALQKQLNTRLDELRAARERLAETAALVDDAAGKDVRRLAEMYQQMKPKQAGQIFNEMAPSFAAGFIGEMRPDAAALIMANMDADKAYAVSLLLAGRNVRPQATQPQPGTQAVPASQD